MAKELKIGDHVMVFDLPNRRTWKKFGFGRKGVITGIYGSQYKVVFSETQFDYEYAYADELKYLEVDTLLYG